MVFTIRFLHRIAMKVIRLSLPHSLATRLDGNRSLYIRSAAAAFARSKVCRPGITTELPALNVREQMKAAKLSMKVDPEWAASMKRIANKVVTDRPRGERLSRFFAAAVAWQMA